MIRTRRLAVILLAGLLFSCSASPTVFLDKNGGGRSEFRLRLEKPFVEYLLDIGEAGGLVGSREKAVIFDLPAIEKKLAAYAGVNITRLRAPSAGEIDLAFTFSDAAVFARPGGLSPKGGLLTVERGEKKSIRLRLDKAAVNQLLTAFIHVKETELEYFLPRPGETREDYYDNLDFALDGGAALFKQSAITFLITVDGAILEHNGVLKKPGTVQFSVPLEAVLFLSKSLEYYIVYQ